MKELRIGQGIDLHRFMAGRKLFLGGVFIPGESGLEGHSDADVLLHALCDALLGAAGLPDIGNIFPNTEKRWENASSITFLEEVKGRISRLGWRVNNIDCSIVAEKPKIAPYISQMKEVIADKLQIDQSQCGIKATTPEGLGALGRGEGIMAFATVLLTK